MALKQKIRNRQGGFIVSAELLFITTILVIGMLVGWVAVRDAAVAELHDLAEAIGELDQTYVFQGIADAGTGAGTQGTVFGDQADDTSGVANAQFGFAGTAGDNEGVNFALPPGASEGIQN